MNENQQSEKPMTLQDFISTYDKENTIVLLEGKRNVPDPDKNKLIAFGKLLATQTSKMIFRSGNAKGADYLFSCGVASIDKHRLQVITPYSGHRQTSNLAYDTIALNDIHLAAEPEIIYQSKSNPKMKRLIDQYVSGERDRYSMKAAYILRDTIKVMGTENIKPASFGIFYDDLNNPFKGGTGHTMKICKQNNIPMIDQRVWFEWLNSF